jgi:hypothetical protein
MQIFASSSSPKECAIVLDDLRLNKMTLESSQMLSAALFINNISKEILPCKPGWSHHPLSKWAAFCSENYIWLFEHFIQLCKEFEYRRNKKHVYNSHIQFYVEKHHFISLGKQTQFLNCTIFKDRTDNIHDIYKDYLNWKWNNGKRIPRWTKRRAPEWRIQKQGGLK